MLGKFFPLLLFAFLFGCESNDEPENIDQVVNDFLQPQRTIDSSMMAYWKEASLNHLSLGTFLSYYYAHFDSTFSLDDDLVLMPMGITEYFMYSKNKTNNKIWSSVCGVYENLSSEQVGMLDSLENEMRIESQKKHLDVESNEAIFLWKGKKHKDIVLQKRFEYFMNSDTQNSKTKLYNYLVKKVFVHGCKKHLLNPI